jgi:rhodanese-related sulfurtransferase
MEETLSELCTRNQRLDIDEVMAHIRDSHDIDAAILIEPEALKELREVNPDLKILDIRTKEEFEAAQIEGSIHMTAQVGSNTSCVTTAQDLLHQVVDNWDSEELFVVVDHQGEQGLDVATYFLGHGMKQARCLRGGIDAWSLEIDRSVPRYEFT